MDITTPQGFRDVLIGEAAEREAMVRRVQAVMDESGYVPIETPTLEYMDAMSAGGRIPRSPFKFFDAQGNLVTMRPDVTLQVARMCATRLKGEPGPFKFRYIQRVFRESEGQVHAGAREKKQMGVEFIGATGRAADAEVVGLCIRALEIAGVEQFTLSLATVGVLRSLLTKSGASELWISAVLEAFHSSNFVEIDRLCGPDAQGDTRYAQAIAQLARIRGGKEAIAEARKLVAPLECDDALKGFEELFDELTAQGLAERILVDFAVMSSFDYYTGIVFEAYSSGLGTPLGSGGRYDNLLAQFGDSRPAAGFAFYIEEVQAAIRAAEDMKTCAKTSASSTDNPARRPLRIAVPKGSLNADTVEALAAAGLDVTGLEHPGRMLVIHADEVDYIIVRPTDAPVFVEMGAADCGICGEDSLIESGADVVQLVDLRFGACRFVVAEPEGAAERNAAHYQKLGSIRVATKYPRIARAHFMQRGVQVEIVQLHGNIELGPLTGLAECIVDITATGTTLRENKLVITDEVIDSTARFFSNVCSLRTDPRVSELATRLSQFARGRELKVTAGGEATQV